MCGSITKFLPRKQVSVSKLHSYYEAIQSFIADLVICDTERHAAGNWCACVYIWSPDSCDISFCLLQEPKEGSPTNVKSVAQWFPSSTGRCKLFWNKCQTMLFIIIIVKADLRYFINPLGLGTSGLLTPFLIGSYLEMCTCVANYDKALKMLHAQSCIWDYLFLTPFLIGSINGRIFILTNRQVVLMGLQV